MACPVRKTDDADIEGIAFPFCLRQAGDHGARLYATNDRVGLRFLP